MNGRLISRTTGWILLIVAVLVLALALDRRDANVAQARALEALQQQWKRAHAPLAPASGAAGQAAVSDPAAEAAQALVWREAARSQGSDARNAAYVLETTKRLCEASGLKECQVRRSGAKLNTPGQSAQGLVPHAVNVLARFDARGVEQFSRGLQDSSLLYRVERVHIIQARAEWDVVFLMLPGTAAPVAGPLTAASVPRGKGASASAPDRPRLWAAEPPPEPKPVAPGKAKPLTPDYWKIAGVYGSGKDRRAIVEYAPPRSSEYLQVGATLPNGAQILALEKNSVTVKAKVANQWKTIVLEF